MSILGSNIPVPLVSCGDHVPPTSGFPPKRSNKSMIGELLHSSIVPSVPALLLPEKDTATVAELVPQELVRVYV